MRESAGDGNRLIQLFAVSHRGGSRRIRRRVVPFVEVPRTIPPPLPPKVFPDDVEHHDGDDNQTHGDDFQLQHHAVTRASSCLVPASGGDTESIG